jgi:hypothetical protein
MQHILCDCPTLSAIATTACDQHIIKSITTLRTTLFAKQNKTKIINQPMPNMSPFWSIPSQQQLWYAQGATPAILDTVNEALGLNEKNRQKIAKKLSLLLIERSEYIYNTRTTLHNKALRERPPPFP